MNTHKFDDLYFWTYDDLLEISLPDPNAFLKIKETLTRIGIPSRDGKRLCQTCHILHKRGKYYLVHFKELFALDDKPVSMTYSDIGRRNRISILLESWKLCTVVTSQEILVPMGFLKIIPFNKKTDWALVPQYTIGKPF